MKSFGVTMIRLDMRNIPQHALPPGYAMRAYRPADEELWVAINNQADTLQDITLKDFEDSYSGDIEGLRERMFFLREEGGRDVGTVTAWYDNERFGRRFGRIHWLAIMPEFQGRGLAKPMMTVAMNRLAELHDRAFLTTSTARPIAIKVYLNFGFVPCIHRDEDEEAWRYFAEQFDHPLLRDPSARRDLRQSGPADRP